MPFSRKEETLQEGLYKHLVGLINRVKGDIQIVNPLKENVKKIMVIFILLFVTSHLQLNR